MVTYLFCQKCRKYFSIRLKQRDLEYSTKYVHKLNPLDPHGLPDLQPHGLPHGRGHGVAHLPVLLKRCSVELVSVREALASGTLPYRHEPVLVGVEDPALLPHGLRVGDGGGEEAVPLHPAVEPSPVVMPDKNKR